MTQKLAGKVAVVTGASKGIGASIATHLGEQGASVVVNYASDRAGAERVVAAIAGKGGKAIAVQGNVAQAGEVERLFGEVKKAFGKVDILVNNAGVYAFAPLSEVTPEHFHRQFDINVLGTLLASQQAAKLFGPSGGSIINVSSVVATLAPAGAAVYSATKAAINAVTISLAKELGPKKVRVNAVAPGMVETEGLSSAGMTESEMRKDIEVHTPLGRIGKPQDIATVVTFLASDDSAWVSGETLYVAGGYR